MKPAMEPNCFSCQEGAKGTDAREYERVVIGEFWRVAHCRGSALPYWMVLVLRRHATAVSQLTKPEVAEYGTLMVAVSAAIEDVAGCKKTYVAQFADSPGFLHTHFHIIPRYPDMPLSMVGPAVFAYLARPASEWLDSDAMDVLARRISPVIWDKLVELG